MRNLSNAYLSEKEYIYFAKKGTNQEREELALNPNITPKAIDILKKDEDMQVRVNIAVNRRTSLRDAYKIVSNPDISEAMTRYQEMGNEHIMLYNPLMEDFGNRLATESLSQRDFAYFYKENKKGSLCGINGRELMEYVTENVTAPASFLIEKANSPATFKGENYRYMALNTLKRKATDYNTSIKELYEIAESNLGDVSISAQTNLVTQGYTDVIIQTPPQPSYQQPTYQRDEDDYCRLLSETTLANNHQLIEDMLMRNNQQQQNGVQYLYDVNVYEGVEYSNNMIAENNALDEMDDELGL